MAMLLNDMKVGMDDKVAEQVIDTFLRESQILQDLPFDDAVTAAGGSTLTYGYVQTKTPSTAGFRAINAEYVGNEAILEKKAVDLKVFGGSFALDRVIRDAQGKYNNLAFQIESKVKAAVGTFHDALINGDSAADELEFDGLDKFLVGTASEYNTEEFIDLSNISRLKENASEFYEQLLLLINRTGANALLVNELMKTKIQTVARELGYKTETEKAFGTVITTIGENGVKLIDLKNVYDAEGNETPIIGVKTRSIRGTTVTGLTDIFGVRYSAQDGFHGVSLNGQKAVKTYLPDFNQPGAVKKGEVEMVAACALKNTAAAGVLRNIKIQ